jgi:hypothetical protein
MWIIFKGILHLNWEYLSTEDYGFLPLDERIEHWAGSFINGVTETSPLVIGLMLVAAIGVLLELQNYHPTPHDATEKRIDDALKPKKTPKSYHTAWAVDKDGNAKKEDIDDFE